MNNKIDKNHNQKRRVLRTIGPILLCLGIIFVIIGMIDFFSAASAPFSGGPGFMLSTDFGGPDLFWCFFIGLPLIFVGGAMTAAGYMGAVARYQAQEIAPVGKDVINYMAKGTSEGIETISRSIHKGITEDKDELLCSSCNQPNPNDAKFCNYCGDTLQSIIICKACNEENKIGAKFCNNCGAKLM